MSDEDKEGALPQRNMSAEYVFLPLVQGNQSKDEWNAKISRLCVR